MIAYTRHVLSGLSLLEMSTSMILLHETPPPLSRHTAVHLLPMLSGALLPFSFGALVSLSLCSRAMWRSSPHILQLDFVLQSLAWWPPVRQRKHSLAFWMNSVFSLRDFAAKALHSIRSWPSRSWKRHHSFSFSGASGFVSAVRMFVAKALQLTGLWMHQGVAVGVGVLPAMMFGWFLVLACLSISCAKLAKPGYASWFFAAYVVTSFSHFAWRGAGSLSEISPMALGSSCMLVRGGWQADCSRQHRGLQTLGAWCCHGYQMPRLRAGALAGRSWSPLCSQSVAPAPSTDLAIGRPDREVVAFKNCPLRTGLLCW